MENNFGDWVYLTHSEQVWQERELTEQEKQRRKEVGEAVRAALEQLSAEEQAIIVRYHFDGLTLKQIGDQLGRSESKTTNLYRRALRRLKKLLTPFAGEQFGIDTQERSCPICASEFRKEIDGVIARKKKQDSYRSLIQRLKSEYGIKIVSPQTIRGHIKYHA